jgi:hypothetical protein
VIPVPGEQRDHRFGGERRRARVIAVVTDDELEVGDAARILVVFTHAWRRPTSQPYVSTLADFTAAYPAAVIDPRAVG